jgi:negative regulator of sigma E activity
MVDKDKISGFVDGEMDGRDERTVYNAVKQSPEALETWRHYHVI